MSQDILATQNSSLAVPIPADITVNAKGLKCPMPVIKLQQTIRNLSHGQIVAIECTDLSAEKDLSSWCKVNKHTLLTTEKKDFGLIVWVKVVKSAIT